ncbi:hypothetical protein E2C01_008395 [Portunus trituberculatus]|uniref:Uncharacterized protein n=1 Tax=Portunus trituberculatus TaxID=210409 RepID=A0A5B7D4J4_PORTR|nr:hypothetical protein [Portunus trituberculatus]
MEPPAAGTALSENLPACQPAALSCASTPVESQLQAACQASRVAAVPPPPRPVHPQSTAHNFSECMKMQNIYTRGRNNNTSWLEARRLPGNAFFKGAEGRMSASWKTQGGQGCSKLALLPVWPSRRRSALVELILAVIGFGAVRTGCPRATR